MKRLYIRLLDLGHPDFFKETQSVLKVICNGARSELSSQVEDAEKSVSKWTTEISKLQENYKWLPFFRLSKMKKLHLLISSERDTVTETLEEITFLINNNPVERKRCVLKVKVK